MIQMWLLTSGYTVMAFVTRNVKDFPFSDISVIPPREFLQRMNVTL